MAKIPAAQNVVIPAAGHAVIIDQPRAFIDAVLPFLDSLPKTVAAERRVGSMIRIVTTVALVAAATLAWHDNADAQTFIDHALPPDGRPPFTATLSNHAPLVIGMNVEQTSQALGQPLHYVSGAPRAEIYLALRNLGGSGLISHRDRLFLQFRNGRLTGWKEDYGQNWMWQ
jgi:hypothetical protein